MTLPTSYPQRIKFNVRSIAALKRDPARVEYVVRNADMPCFGVRLRGDSKTYIDQPRGARPIGQEHHRRR